MNKKIIVCLFTLLFAFSFCQKANAIQPVAEKAENISASVNVNEIKDDEAEIIKKFSLKDKFQRSPENQIKSFYKEFNKLAEKGDIEKLKNLYSDSFINNDGFDKTIIFEMMKQTQDVYKELSYTYTLDFVKVNGNYASVDVHEVAMGATTKQQEEIGDYGLIVSDMYYTDFLKKEGNKWKIASTDIKSEKIALKYGEAKNMAIEIIAPYSISENTEYDVRVSTKSPNGVLVIGSIVNEAIKFPQVQEKDVFKSVKSGVIERVLKSNADGRNEYAAATIGITRASIEPPKVVFNMTGMAFVMSRVNVYSKKENKIKEKETFDE